MYSAHLSSQFFSAVEQMAKSFRERGARVTAIDFLNPWLYESDIGKVKHGHGGLDYHGLNMMNGPNLPGLGWNQGGYAFGEADPATQVPYIQRFYEQMTRAFLGGDFSRLDSATALYLMNFLPAYTKYADDPNHVLTRRGDSTHWYEDNPSFDPEGKGYIEVADLTRALERVRTQKAAYWNEVVARAQSEGGTSLGGLPVGPILAVTGLAAVIYIAYRNGSFRGLLPA